MSATSVTKAPGQDIEAAERNAVRRDALLKTAVGIAGENFNAMTTDAGGWIMPTVVVQIGSSWFKASGGPSNIALGIAQNVGLAFNNGVTGMPFTVVLPGSWITTEFFPTMSGGTPGTAGFPSAATFGGMATFSVTITAWKLLGFFESTGSFYFYPTENSSLDANKGGIGIYIGTADNFSSGLVGQVNSSGLVHQTNSSDLTRFNLGNSSNLFVATHTSTAGSPQRFARAGMVATILKDGGGTWTVGQPVFTSSSYGYASHSQNTGLYTQMIGIAVSGQTVLICPDQKAYGHKMRIKQVVAGANYGVLSPLYFDKTDQRVYPADSDVAISGICEFPYIAIQANVSGAGTTVIVACTGSTIIGSFGFGPGDRLLPGPTTGAFIGNTPASYDTYYRFFGHVGNGGNNIDFDVQEMLFLATGLQEKGYIGVGNVFTSTAFGSGGLAGTKPMMSESFRKNMSNTPSGITLVATASLNLLAAPTIIDVSRFGFTMRIQQSGPTNADYYWYGTYQTVGN